MVDPNTFQLDIHTHTIASGHAYGTLNEMITAAAERGLSLIGVTEHAPGIPGTCHPIYFMNLGVVPRRISGVEVFHGSEVNVLDDGTLSLEQSLLDRLDYGIVGIHAPCYHDAGVEKNTDNLISCMKNEKIFFVSHPDDSHTPLDYERLAEAAKEYHVALEVNNSSLLKTTLRLNCVENYHKMLRICQRLGTPVIVNSDAHHPSGVGRFREACALLNDVGFDPELILNTSVEKFKEFIHFGK